MSKDSSAKYCQNDKERLPKKSSWKIEKSSLKKKEKSDSMVVNDIPQKMKNKSLLSIKKIL